MKLKLIVLACCFFCTAVLADELKLDLKGVAKPNMLRNIQANLSLQKLIGRHDLSAEQINASYQAAKREINEALAPFGYYHAEIISELKIIRRQTWLASFKIQLNQAVVIKKINVFLLGEGEQNSRLKDLINNFPLQENNTLIQEKYSKFKSKLINASEELGFFDAKFVRNEILLDLNNNLASIYLIFYTGPQYYFGAVEFEQAGYRADFLQKFIPFDENTPYSIEKLNALRDGLSKNFDAVVITPQKNKIANLHLPIHVSLVRKKDNLYNFGVGWGTETGPRAYVNWQKRNIGGDGQTLNTALKISQYQYNAELNYLIPGFAPATDQWILNTGFFKILPHQSYNIGSTNYHSALRYNRNSLDNKKQGQLELSWFRENYINYDTEEHTFANLLMPGFSWSKISSNDPYNTNKGSRLKIYAKAAAQPLGSSTSLLQLGIDGKTIMPLSPKLRALLHANVGEVFTEDKNQLPPSLRFFAGGPQSVRGYSYDSLGPVQYTSDGQKVVVGGTKLAVLNSELEYAVQKKWSLAAFFDLGNAMDHWDEGLKSGVGVGVRWKSPIGPFRINLARGLDAPSNGWRIDFNIGPDL